MGLRTVILKLHKPGKAKQRIIDEALLNYNRAFQDLLNIADVRGINERLKGKANRYNTLALSKFIDNNTFRELNKYGVQPFKDSLRFEFGTEVANCLRLLDAKPGAASPNIGFLRPIYFCRYDTKRSYCLLYDKEKDRYFAKLYLLSGANARVVPEASSNSGRLVHIHKDNSVLRRTGRKETFIILPLSFGKWQEKIIKEAAGTPELFRTARLFKKKNDYYLAISVETVQKENIKPESYMGISRGLKNRLNYTVVNPAGEILSAGPLNISGMSPASKGIQLDELHQAANSICEIAVYHKAQVIVENLAEKVDKLTWQEDGEEQYHPEYKLKDYNRLVRILEYKLDWKSLPKPVKVSPVGIFYTCPGCGMVSKRSRLNKDFFICIGCGTAMDIDKLGSLNLARKLIGYSLSKIKIKVTKNNEGIIFSNNALGLELSSPYNENQLERLKNELQKIIDGSIGKDRNSGIKTNAGRSSLIRKLKSVENFLDLIEYI